MSVVKLYDKRQSPNPIIRMLLIISGKQTNKVTKSAANDRSM